MLDRRASANKSDSLLSIKFIVFSQFGFTALSALSTLFDLSARQLPSQCRICHTWPSLPICANCLGQFAVPCVRCDTCALPLPGPVIRCGVCLHTPPPLDACLAAVSYAYPWSRLIADYKFGSQPALARILADLLRTVPGVLEAVHQASLLLPIPLSRERLQWRGYNQSLLLARELSGSKTRSDVLLRIRDTPIQHTLHRAERLKSLHNAFALEPGLAALVKDKRVVLIDDVMTSGASLDTAARVLRSGGAAHITGVVVARTAAHEAIKNPAMPVNMRGLRG